MIHLGDITKINGATVPRVHIITGGSPCQDLSVAGKRAGLAGERSGLFMEQIRIIKEMRDADKADGRSDVDIRPRYMVWENVPGAFSSNGGEDFRTVLEETVKIVKSDVSIPRPQNGKWAHAGCIMGDGWSVAWRLHDAQYWGVPQRRKRIALVADFAGGGALEILFESQGLQGHTQPGSQERQGTASDAQRGTRETGTGALSFQERAGKPGGGKGILIQDEHTGALSTVNNQSVCAFTTEMTPKTDEHGVAFALRDRDYKDPQSIVYGIGSFDSNAMKSGNPDSGIYKADTSRTLDPNGANPACNQGGMIVLEGNGSRPSHSGDGYSESEVSYTLNAVEQHAVAYRGDAITSPVNASNPKDGDPCHTLTDDSRNYVVIENHPADSRVKVSQDGKVQTLSSRMGTGGGNVPMVMAKVAASRCAANGGKGVHSQMLENPEENFVLCIGNGQVNQLYLQDKVGALNTLDDPQKVIIYGLDRAAYNQGQNAKFDFSIDEEKVGAQTSRGPRAVMAVDCQNSVEGQINGTLQSRASNNNNSNNVVRLCSIVRRLTPLECERLQGFPDFWTDIGEWVDSKGKKHKGDSDAPRYKALGNSIALPFWDWMAERMIKILGVDSPTMASLFDGIGGFPLVFSRVGCRPVWASEIEEFPIAVTKIRFPEEDQT